MFVRMNWTSFCWTLERKLDGQSVVVGIKDILDGAFSCQLDLVPEVALGRHTAAVSIVFRSQTLPQALVGEPGQVHSSMDSEGSPIFGQCRVDGALFRRERTCSNIQFNFDISDPVYEVYPDEVGFSQQDR